MIDESVGKLHKRSKDEDASGGMSVQWDEDSTSFSADPNEVLEMRNTSCFAEGEHDTGDERRRGIPPSELVCPAPSGSQDGA